MPETVFDQNFVFCSVCHQRSSTGNPLMLTSCAHTLCDKHLSPDNICVVCQTRDISTIKLNDPRTLPNDVKLFFEPLPNILETIYNVSLFQINGLNEQVQYYQVHCIKLREKVARQQQLLYQAKKELDTIPLLKEKIQSLETSIQSLTSKSQNSWNSYGRNNGYDNVFDKTHFFQRKSNSSFSSGVNNRSNSNLPPPPTVDLTLDSDEYNEQQHFINKLKQTTTTLRNNTHLQRTASVSNNISSNQSKKQDKLGRSSTIGSNVAPPQYIQRNERRLNNIKNISIPHNEDLVMAESTQLNKFNSSSESNIQNGLTIPSDNPSPSTINHDNKLITPPGSDINKNDKYQRRRMSTIGTGRIQFPTPLEKLKIGKRNVSTGDDGKSLNGQSKQPTVIQCMKRRSSTSQVDSPKQFANKITKTFNPHQNNDARKSNKRNTYFRGQSATGYR